MSERSAVISMREITSLDSANLLRIRAVSMPDFPFGRFLVPPVRG